MYKQILLVDDDICLAYAIQSYISSKSRQIFIVSDSVSAMQLLRIYSFDLIISDIMMPYVNGYDFLVHVRDNSNLLHIPFIFLTAKGMTGDRIKGYNLGCNAYLTKPFHPSELLSLINSLLALSSSNDYSVKDYKNIRENMLYYQMMNFTSREMSILKLLTKGITNREIASILNLSQKNVEKYVSRLLEKTNTRNRTELARLYVFYSHFQKGE